ncbi:hypothetical protein ElP_54610 [Tautonia plasticadhaerens]|uniref:HTH cro/C1-type domain-containing protein n=1 Tax=Tautonia plasticadhaerens TaxID=2527974 RepID=A0A518H9K5_9BACT|nr:hypothetical protein ElP_54610 [Tautonia plasticadhaerens]
MDEFFRRRDGDCPGEPPSDTLRSAVRRRGLTAWRLAKISGVNEHVARRFMRQGSRLRSDTFDRLCTALGLILLDPDHEEDPRDRAGGG